MVVTQWYVTYWIFPDVVQTTGIVDRGATERAKAKATDMIVEMSNMWMDTYGLVIKACEQ